MLQADSHHARLCSEMHALCIMPARLGFQPNLLTLLLVNATQEGIWMTSSITISQKAKLEGE